MFVRNPNDALKVNGSHNDRQQLSDACLRQMVNSLLGEWFVASSFRVDLEGLCASFLGFQWPGDCSSRCTIYCVMCDLRIVPPVSSARAPKELASNGKHMTPQLFQGQTSSKRNRVARSIEGRSTKANARNTSPKTGRNTKSLGSTSCSKQFSSGLHECQGD